jgi:hypothetical protein
MAASRKRMTMSNTRCAHGTGWPFEGVVAVVIGDWLEFYDVRVFFF